MLRLRDIVLTPEQDESQLLYLAATALGIPANRIADLQIRKKSIDARKKPEIRILYTLDVALHSGERQALRRCRKAEPVHERYYKPPRAAVCPAVRPVVVGFGPAGMFAALVLAKAGARPIVLERGQDAPTRLAAVEAFRAGGRLDAENNVQFGEGGAGTFSDGKLNTGTHDPRLHWVLAQFAAHGAPESVRYDAKPHIGTDVLVDVVQSIRREIVALGGEVRFGAKLTGLAVEDGRVAGAVVNGEETLPCEALILAIGHSARDSFVMLRDLGVPMERKPFSMGVRIEHRQERVDLAQYGRARGSLPAADYALNVHLPDGTSAYTFCMCPGGEVFAAASEEGGVVTNGMSHAARAGENANAALLVTLHAEDFPGEGVLRGMVW